MTYTVKLIRQSMNKTQEEMAKLMGVSRDTYRKIELHPETATIPQAKKFCDVTGMNVDQLNFFAP